LSFADGITAKRISTTLVDIAPITIEGLTRPVVHQIVFDASQSGSQVTYDCKDPITRTEAKALHDYYARQAKTRHGSAKLAAIELEKIYRRIEVDLQD
jgi:hypothetical protein